MAKKARLTPSILFLLSASLLSSAWLIPPFPINIFLGLAPLLAILDDVKEDRVWDRAELIWVALVLSYFAAHHFTLVVPSMIQGVIITLSFIGASFIRQRLSVGQWVVIVFWLALEHLAALSPWRDTFVYLGDALTMQPSWFHWTAFTGYSGTTFWILLVNFLLYLGLLKGDKIDWMFTTFSILILVVPILMSLFRDDTLISRIDLVNMYSSLTTKNFLTGGDVIHEAATGISALILVAALVRNKSGK